MKNMFRKCGSCFRFEEDWRDVETKGLKQRESISFADISKKPRKGVAVKCMSVHKKDAPKANDYGCEYHKYRCTWNLEQWWRWSFMYKLRRWFCVHIRCPIGGLRKPVPLEWVDSFDGMTDKIIPNSEPRCPHCGEMPYSTEQCVFCGQRFVQDGQRRREAEPPKVETMDCFICGGEGTMKGCRAKINGHFHGKCEKCEAVMME